MNKTHLPRKFIFIALGVIVIALLGLFIFFGNGTSRQSGADAQNPSMAVNDGNGASSSDPSSVLSSTSTGEATDSPNSFVTSSMIDLVTPTSGDQWTIGESNPISWNQGASTTGEIDLLDAKTGNFVGVILSETEPQQISYSWDTQEVYLARYNPLKKDVVPGTYVIRLKFDGDNLPDVTSDVITITQ